MYGMVNKAIEEMVCSAHGEEAWEIIKEKAGVKADVFISNESYPDEMTYKLVASACELTGAPAEEILEAFGEHWVLKTARDAYGSLLDAGGKTLPEFLINLPNFHARVVMIYPKLKPPSFRVTNLQPRSLDLHYITHRPGLQSFVVGLIRGIGKMFETPATVTLLESRDSGADHEVFRVQW